MMSNNTLDLYPTGNNAVTVALVKLAKKRMERNLAMAEQFSHNKELEDKFLSQACEQEAILIGLVHDWYHNKE